MAAIEIIFESAEAQKGAENLDKRLKSLDRTTSKVAKNTSSMDRELGSIRNSSTSAAASLRRLEGNSARLEKSLDKISRSMNKVHKMMKSGAISKYTDAIDKLTQANQALTDAHDKVKNDLRATAKNLADAKRQAHKYEKEITKLKSSLERTGKSMMLFGYNIGAVNTAMKNFLPRVKLGEYLMTTFAQAGATFIATNIVGYLIRMTDQFKLMESRLKIVNSGISILNTNLANSVSIALATRQSLFAIGNLMARIGRNSQDLKNNTLALSVATSTISKSFQIAGATAEEARNAIVQLSQALASGRLQGDELRSILELAPTLAESISKSIGITVGQLRAFASEGLITTKIMLAAVAQSTDQINKDFAKIRPTVSQSLTNVQTAMQAVLGFNEGFKRANDALANSFMSLALYIEKFANDSEKIAPIAQLLEKISGNFIQLTFSVVSFGVALLKIILIVKAVQLALQALAATATLVDKILTASGVGSIAMAAAKFAALVGRIIALVFALREGAKAFEAADSAIGDLAKNTLTYGEVVEKVENRVKKINEEALLRGEKEIDNIQKISMLYNELGLAVENSQNAVNDLTRKIKLANKELEEFEGSAKEKLRFISGAVESVVVGLFQYISSIIKGVWNLLEMMYEAVRGTVLLLFSDILRIGGIFSDSMASWGDSLRSESKKAFSGAREDLNDFNEALSDLLNPSRFKGETTLTDMFFGKSAEGKRKEIDELEKLRDEEVKKLSKLEAEQKKVAEKGIGGETAREIMLKRFRAATEAAVYSYRLEAKIARREFEYAFEKPLNISYTPVQSSLSGFMGSLQKDLQSELQNLVKEASFDITEIVNLDDFNAESFIKKIRAAGKEINQSLDFTSAEYGPDFKVSKPGELEKMLGLDGLLEKIKDKSKPLQDALKEIMDIGGDPIIMERLGFKLQEIVEKYKSNIIQSLLQMQEAIKKMETTKIKELEDSEGELKVQKEIAEARVDAAKAGDKSLKVRNTEIEKTIEREKNLYLERYKAEVGLENVSADFIENVNTRYEAIKEVNKELAQQERLLEAALEIEQARKGLSEKSSSLAVMQLELDLIRAGVSEIEREKRIQEAVFGIEQNSLEERLKSGEIDQERYDVLKGILISTQNLLSLEKDITREKEAQKDLQKSEEMLAKEKILDQIKAAAIARQEEMGVIDTFLVSAGLRKDPIEAFIKQREDFLDAMLSAGAKATQVHIDAAGNISPDINFINSLDKNAREAFLKMLANYANAAVLQSKERNPNLSVGQRIATQLGGNEAPIQKFADGGYVDPNSTNSKGEVLSILHAGEYVLSADVVKTLGYDILRELNNPKRGRISSVTTVPTAESLIGTGNNDAFAEVMRKIEKVYEKGSKEYERAALDLMDYDSYGVDYMRRMSNNPLSDNFVGKALPLKTAIEYNKDFARIGQAAATTKLNQSLEEFKEKLETEAEAADKKTLEELKQEELKAEYQKSIEKAIDKVRDAAVDWKTVSKDILKADFGYKNPNDPSGFSMGGVGGAIAGGAAGVGAIYGMALSNDQRIQKMTDDIASIFLSGDPVTGLIKATADRLLENEKFQEQIVRMLDLFYSAFDGFAEGLAIFMEALLDMVEPLRPLMEMIGGFMKSVMRALTQIIEPFAKIFEALTPVLIYLSAVLQLVAGFISVILGAIGDIFDDIITSVLGWFGIDFGNEYKSLNLLKQERDILTELNTSISGLADSLKEIQDIIFEIMNSTLNISAAGVKLELATDKYEELFAAATRLGASDEDISAFENFAKEYLQQSQDVLKTSSSYQAIYTKVIEDLATLEETIADDVGAQLTEALKIAIFDLKVAGSDIGDELVKAVDKYKDGILSFTDLATYIGFKLSQIDKDIDLKEFSDFGAIGDFENVAKAYESYLADELGRFYNSIGDAISSSTLEEDLLFLFGINPDGSIASASGGYTTASSRTAVTQALSFATLSSSSSTGTTSTTYTGGYTTSEAALARSQGRTLSRQPTIGDVGQAPDVGAREDQGGLPDLGLPDLDIIDWLAKLAQGIWDSLVTAIENIIGTFAEFLEAIFGWIKDLGITVQAFLEEFFSWLNNLTISAADFLTELFGWVDDLSISSSSFLTELFGWVDDLSISASDFLDNVFSAIGNLSIDASDFLTSLLDSIFGESTSPISIINGLTEFLNKIFGENSFILTPVTALGEILESIIGNVDLLDAGGVLQEIIDVIIGEGDPLSYLGVFGEIFDKLFEGATGSVDIPDILGELLDSIFDATGGKLSFLDGLTEFFEKIFVDSGLITPLRGVSEFLSNIFESGNLLTLTRGLEVLLENILDSTKKLDIWDAFQTVINEIFSGAGVIDLAQSFGQILTKIMGTGDPLGAAGAFGEIIDKIVSGVTDAVGALGSIISSLIGGSAADPTAAIGKIIDELIGGSATDSLQAFTKIIETLVSGAISATKMFETIIKNSLDGLATGKDVLLDIFGEAKKTVENLFLLKNPFYGMPGFEQFDMPEYLIKFEEGGSTGNMKSGGVANGPSHDNGGILTKLASNDFIEIEGGEYIINKETVSTLGTGFFDYVNSIRSSKEFPLFRSGGEVPKYASGGFAGLTGWKYFNFDELDAFGNISDALENLVELDVSGFRWLNRTTNNSGKSGSDPAGYMFPSWENLRFQIIKVNMKTGEWFTDLMGKEHGIVGSMRFPDGGNFNVYANGGQVGSYNNPKAYNDGNITITKTGDIKKGTEKFLTDIGAPPLVTDLFSPFAEILGGFFDIASRFGGSLTNMFSQFNPFAGFEFTGAGSKDTSWFKLILWALALTSILNSVDYIQRQTSGPTTVSDFVGGRTSVLNDVFSTMPMSALALFLLLEGDDGASIADRLSLGLQENGFSRDSADFTLISLLGTLAYFLSDSKSFKKALDFGNFSNIGSTFASIPGRISRSFSGGSSGSSGYSGYSYYGSGGELFADGGLAVGPSHQSGILGYAPGGGPFLFEGGEYIIRKDVVDAVGIDSLDALNSGAIHGLNLRNSVNKGGIFTEYGDGGFLGGMLGSSRKLNFGSLAAALGYGLVGALGGYLLYSGASFGQKSSYSPQTFQWPFGMDRMSNMVTTESSERDFSVSSLLKVLGGALLIKYAVDNLIKSDVFDYFKEKVVEPITDIIFPRTGDDFSDFLSPFALKPIDGETAFTGWHNDLIKDKEIRKYRVLPGDKFDEYFDLFTEEEKSNAYGIYGKVYSTYSRPSDDFDHFFYKNQLLVNGKENNNQVRYLGYTNFYDNGFLNWWRYQRPTIGTSLLFSRDEKEYDRFFSNVPNSRNAGLIAANQFQLWAENYYGFNHLHPLPYNDAGWDQFNSIGISDGENFEREYRTWHQRYFGTSYGDGGRVQNGGLAVGPSHQSGMVGYARGGKPFLFEGGEYIINKKATQKIGVENLNRLNAYGSGGALPQFDNGTSSRVDWSLSAPWPGSDSSSEEWVEFNIFPFLDRKGSRGGLPGWANAIQEYATAFFDLVTPDVFSVFWPDSMKGKYRPAKEVASRSVGFLGWLWLASYLSRTDLRKVDLLKGFGSGGTLDEFAYSQDSITNSLSYGFPLSSGSSSSSSSSNPFSGMFKGIGDWFSTDNIENLLLTATVIGLLSQSDWIQGKKDRSKRKTLFGSIFGTEYSELDDLTRTLLLGLSTAGIGFFAHSRATNSSGSFLRSLGFSRNSSVQISDFIGFISLLTFAENLLSPTASGYPTLFEDITGLPVPGFDDRDENLNISRYYRSLLGHAKPVDKEFAYKIVTNNKQFRFGFFSDNQATGLKFATIADNNFTDFKNRAGSTNSNNVYSFYSGLMNTIGSSNSISDLPFFPIKDIILINKDARTRGSKTFGEDLSFTDMDSRHGNFWRHWFPDLILAAYPHVLTNPTSGGDFIENFFDPGQRLQNKNQTESVQRSILNRWDSGGWGLDSGDMHPHDTNGLLNWEEMLRRDWSGFLGSSYMNMFINWKKDTYGENVFAKGGSLTSASSGLAIGPSHQSGMLGVTKAGAPFLFEGGEYIIQKSAVDKIGINKLNQLNQMGNGGSLPEFERGVFLDDDITQYFEKLARVNSMKRELSSIRKDSGWMMAGAIGSSLLGLFALSAFVGAINSGEALKKDGNLGVLLLAMLGMYGGYKGSSYLLSQRGDGGSIPEFGIGGMSDAKSIGALLLGLLGYGEYRRWIGKDRARDGIQWHNVLGIPLMWNMQFLEDGGSVPEFGKGGDLALLLAILGGGLFGTYLGSRSPFGIKMAPAGSKPSRGGDAFMGAIISSAILGIRTKNQAENNRLLLAALGGAFFGSGGFGLYDKTVTYSDLYGAGGSVPEFAGGTNEKLMKALSRGRRKDEFLASVMGDVSLSNNLPASYKLTPRDRGMSPWTILLLALFGGLAANNNRGLFGLGEGGSLPEFGKGGVSSAKLNAFAVLLSLIQGYGLKDSRQYNGQGYFSIFAQQLLPNLFALHGGKALFGFGEGGELQEFGKGGFNAAKLNAFAVFLSLIQGYGLKDSKQYRGQSYFSIFAQQLLPNLFTMHGVNALSNLGEGGSLPEFGKGGVKSADLNIAALLLALFQGYGLKDSRQYKGQSYFSIFAQQLLPNLFALHGGKALFGFGEGGELPKFVNGGPLAYGLGFLGLYKYFGDLREDPVIGTRPNALAAVSSGLLGIGILDYLSTSRDKRGVFKGMTKDQNALLLLMLSGVWGTGVSEFISPSKTPVGRFERTMFGLVSLGFLSSIPSIIAGANYAKNKGTGGDILKLAALPALLTAYDFAEIAATGRMPKDNGFTGKFLGMDGKNGDSSGLGMALRGIFWFLSPHYVRSLKPNNVFDSGGEISEFSDGGIPEFGIGGMTDLQTAGLLLLGLFGFNEYSNYKTRQNLARDPNRNALSNIFTRKGPKSSPWDSLVLLPLLWNMQFLEDGGFVPSFGEGGGIPEYNIGGFLLPALGIYWLSTLFSENKNSMFNTWPSSKRRRSFIPEFIRNMFSSGGSVSSFESGGALPSFAGGGYSGSVPEFGNGGTVPEFAGGGGLITALLGSLLMGGAAGYFGADRGDDFSWGTALGVGGLSLATIIGLTRAFLKNPKDTTESTAYALGKITEGSIRTSADTLKMNWDNLREDPLEFTEGTVRNALTDWHLSFGGLFGGGVAQLMYDYYQNSIGRSKKLDPMMMVRLRKAGMTINETEDIRWVLGKTDGPVESRDVQSLPMADSLLRMLDAHPHAYVVGNLITIREEIFDLIKNMGGTFTGFGPEDNLWGDDNFWETFGNLIAHESFHTLQYKRYGDKTNYDQVSDFLGDYFNSPSRFENEAESFATIYDSIFRYSSQNSYVEGNLLNEYASGGKLQTGGIAVGPSHQSGMIGYAPGGGPFLFEGGEYIINKRAVDKIGVKTLNMINKGGKPQFASGTLLPLYSRRDIYGLTSTTDPETGNLVFDVNYDELEADGIIPESTAEKITTGIGKVLASIFSPKFEKDEETQKQVLSELSLFAQEMALVLSNSPLFIYQFSELAVAQMAQAMMLGSGAASAQAAPSMDDMLLQAAIIAGMTAKGYDPSGVLTGVSLGRATAEPGKEDQATAAAIIAGVAALGSGTAWIAAIAGILSIVAGQYFGQPGKYLADFDADLDKDFKEPYQGFADEFEKVISGEMTLDEISRGLDGMGERLTTWWKGADEYLTSTLEDMGIDINMREVYQKIIDNLFFPVREFEKVFSGSGIDSMAAKAFESFLAAIVDSISKIDIAKIIEQFSKFSLILIAAPFLGVIKFIESNGGVENIANEFLKGLILILKTAAQSIATIFTSPRLLFGLAFEIVKGLGLATLVAFNTIVGLFVDPEVLGEAIKEFVEGIPRAIFNAFNSLGEYLSDPENTVPIAFTIILKTIDALAKIFTSIDYAELAGAVGATLASAAAAGIKSLLGGGTISLVQFLVDLVKDKIEGMFSGGGGGIFGSIGGVFGKALNFGSTVVGKIGGGLFSDEELKTNKKLVGVNSQGLGIYSWDWNSKAKELGIQDPTGYGVIAQEVMKVMPRAVSEIGGYLAVDYNQIDLNNIGTAGFTGLSYLDSENEGSSVSTGQFTFSSGSSQISSEISNSSSMNNALLSRLIEVLEEKEMSVTVVDENGNEKEDAKYRFIRERESKYRRATPLV